MTPIFERRVVAAAAAILVGLAVSAPKAASAGTHPPTALTVETSHLQRAHLQRALDSLVAAGVPGAILVVRDRNRTVRITSGLGDVVRHTPMRPGDRFRIASQTKTYVSTVLLQLVREGRLRLSDSIERWLPGLVPKGEGITIRQLLNHTTGLFDFAGDPRVLEPYLAGDLGHSWAPRQLIRIAVSHPPLFTPGAAQSYSNTNYILAGLIISAASGNTLRGELNRRIFQPLHLDATSFPTAPGIRGRHAHGYLVLRDPLAIDITKISPFPWAAGAIISTASDDLDFYRALLSGRLLGARLLLEMKTTVPVEGAPAGVGYGLGLGQSTTRCGTAWGHNGAFGGFYSDIYTSEHGRHQALLMVNLDRSSHSQQINSLFYQLLEAAYCSTFTTPGKD